MEFVVVSRALSMVDVVRAPNRVDKRGEGGGGGEDEESPDIRRLPS